MEGRDTLRYHRALAQQTTVSKYRQETLEGISVHLAVVTSDSGISNTEATPPCVVSELAAQCEAASATPTAIILDNECLRCLLLVL